MSLFVYTAMKRLDVSFYWNTLYETVQIRNTWPISYSITNPQSLRALPLLSCSLSHGTTSHLVHELFASLHLNFGTLYLLTSEK